MVRLTVELINDSLQFINTVRDRELNLRACKIPVLENLGVSRDQFDTIDLTDNDIRKLENIPLLKRLATLLMHNNRVQQIMPNIGEVLPSLKTLALTNNSLCELGDLDPLATCKKLEYLTLIGNPVTHKPQYRYYVIFKVPSVRVLDFKRIRLAEREKAKELFQGKKGKKLRDQVVKRSKAFVDENQSQVPSRLLRDTDSQLIQAAIESASTFVEIDRLQTILQSGRIPEKNWQKISSNENSHMEENNMEENDEFEQEKEDQDAEYNRTAEETAEMTLEKGKSNENNDSLKGLEKDKQIPQDEEISGNSKRLSEEKETTPNDVHPMEE